MTTRRAFLATSLEASLAAGLCTSLPLSWAESVKPLQGSKLLYSCSSVNYISLTLEETCKRIAALGFDAIDIWDSVDGYLNCPHLKQVADELKADGLKVLLDKHNLKLANFTVYLAKYPQYAELLGQCGGGVAVRSSRARTGDDLTQDMKKFMEELKPEIELCEKYDSYLAIENHGGDFLLNNIDTFKAFVDLNKSRRVGLALAPHHLMNNKESVVEAIRVCGSQLLFIYMWTNEPGEKQMPGVGETDMTDWLKTLKEIGYSRPITPFMHDQPAPDRMDELHRISRNYLNQICKKIV